MNAIILAAGLGSRFKEVTKNNHKALLEIQGVPNLERTITYLIEAEISDIKIVVGYLAEKFDYLTEKYPEVTLVYNDKFKEFNNLYTFSKVLTSFSNSFVIDADTVLSKNVFLNKPKTSTYYTVLRDEVNEEWLPVVDEYGKVIGMDISDERRYSLSGISYWETKDCVRIKNEFEKYLNEKTYLNSSLYWDNVPMGILSELNVTETKLNTGDIFEMDTVENYNFIKLNIN